MAKNRQRKNRRPSDENGASSSVPLEENEAKIETEAVNKGKQPVPEDQREEIRRGKQPAAEADFDLGTGNKQTGSDPQLPRSSTKSRKKSCHGAESSASGLGRRTEDGVAISVGGDPQNPDNVPAANGYRQSGWTYIFYLLFYVLLGSSIYYFSQLCSEGTEFRGGGISFIDGLYVSTQTVTTVGYGDVLPATTFSKAFILCYVSAGLFLLIVYEIVSEVMDRFEIWIMEVCGMKKNRTDNPTVHETKLLIRIVISLTYLVSSIVGCVFALSHWENMKGFKAVYVLVFTVTTLGFGDLSFTSTRGEYSFHSGF